MILLDAALDFTNPYVIVIAVSIVIIISYLFNQVSKKTNIPSVLLLIALGVGFNYLFDFLGVGFGDKLLDVLSLLGIVGLIMIVLEAALDLELTAEKKPLILKSFFVALLSLAASALLIAYLLHYFKPMDYFTSLVYAVPLAIMSSAIIIPSVARLVGEKREFMIYEGTFSDILGIMFFYFLIDAEEGKSSLGLLQEIGLNIVVTVVVSVTVSYLLVWLFQKLTDPVKLFLLISVLLLLYSFAKLQHLSSLLIILVFGLVLNNHRIFFVGKLQKWIDADAVKHILAEFHIVTMESAFVVRTFFFVIFGMTLNLRSLLNLDAALISLGIIGILYGVRLVVLAAILRKNLLPELFLAPRGLITILLFFSIPLSMVNDNFNAAILLYVILLSSIIMTLALIFNKEGGPKPKELVFEDWEELDAEIEHLREKQKEAEAAGEV
jgi:NhaP-type Na+/H+ or K+/H+ antiporter